MKISKLEKISSTELSMVVRVTYDTLFKRDIVRDCLITFWRQSSGNLSPNTPRWMDNDNDIYSHTKQLSHFFLLTNDGVTELTIQTK